MLFEIFDDGKFLGFEDAPNEEAAIVVFANKRHSRADPFKTLAEVRQDQGFPHREATAVAAYATMPPAEAASADDQASFASAFDLVCRLDEAKATAARLRAAADRTTGLECEANIRLAEAAEAEIARIEAALRGEESTEAKEGDATPAKQHKTRGRKPSDAPALLVQILDALESYAATTGQDFDRHTMPGPLGESADDKGSFHWLCARLHPRTFKRAADTFAKHRAGLCAVAPYAKPTDFYRLALPHIAPKLGVTLNVHHMPKQGRKLA